MIDSKPLLESETKLTVGPHELAIAAPNHSFFTDTVDITSGQILVMTPELVPLGAPVGPKPPPKPINCAVPGPANRFGRACYDKPPLPIGSARVPLSGAVSGTPSPAILLVKVSADGKTLVVQSNTPSSDAVFQDLAVNFARSMKWQPAQKAGAAVEGWTQFAFLPADR
jgi:hypothetical protein